MGSEMDRGEEMDAYFDAAMKHPFVLLGVGIVVIFLLMHRATRVR